MIPVRLLVLLAVILVLQWFFLAWVFGKWPALGIFGLVLVLVGVVVLGDHWNLPPEWIVFVSFVLVAATVGYWSWASGSMPALQVVVSVVFLTGIIAAGLVAYEQDYPASWVARMDGLLLLGLILFSLIWTALGGKT